MKIKKIILLSILIIFPIIKTNASETLEYKEEFKTYYDTDSEINSNFILNTKEISDGYLATFVEMDGNESYIVKLDSNGNIVWQKDIGQSPEADIIGTNNENIIYSTASSNKYSYTVSLLDDSGEDLKTILEFENSTSYSSNGRMLFNIEDNYLFIINQKNTTLLYTIDDDGNIVNNTTLDNYTTYGITTEDDTTYLFSYNDTNEKYYIITLSSSLEYTTQELDSSALSDSEQENIADGKFTSLVAYNNNLYFATTYGIYEINMSSYKINLKITGDKSSNSTIDYTSLDILNDYFIAGGVTNDDNDYTIALAVIYDNNFNEIERLKINEIFEIDSSSSLSITKGITVVSDGFIINGMLVNKPFLIKYSIPFNIYTKTDGNGTIDISTENAYSGTEISFTITPNDGYEIESLTITDSSGNNIDYTDEYTFTMPNSDVTIEVTFTTTNNIIINPNTGDSIIFITIVVTISIILIIKNKIKLSHQK